MENKSKKRFFHLPGLVEGILSRVGWRSSENIKQPKLPSNLNYISSF